MFGAAALWVAASAAWAGQFDAPLFSSFLLFSLMVATHDPLPFLPLGPDVVVLEEGRVKAVAKAEAVRALYLERCGGELCARPGGAVPVVGYDVSA